MKMASAVAAMLLAASMCAAQVRELDLAPGEFSAERGFGWEPTSTERARSYSIKVPEGVYRVSLKLSGPGTLSVKAESRQLLLLNRTLAAGAEEDVILTLAMRTPAIPGGGSVGIKDRERGIRRWDDKLTLEFCGDIRMVSAASLTPAPVGTRVVYVVGDSTVADQSVEPWASWGQMLPVLLRSDIAVANHAESGESLTSFLAARRWAKVLATLKAGDVVLIQMGHNDQKLKGEGVGAFTTYKANLEKLIAEARAKGATPVLVTSMHRRTFNKQGQLDESLGDFPAAVRQAAGETRAPLIDLHEASRTLYVTLGPEGSGVLFVDKTHHNNFGAYLLARCVTARLAGYPDLRDLIKPDFQQFDPAMPGTAEQARLPSSAERDPTKPEGN
jgi:lysophospholipase L1-like esterase